MTQFLESGFMFEPEEREDNDTDTQEDVSEFPDANFTDADEELGIFGLGEGEVQSALTNTGQERFHTRLYDHLDKSPDEQIDAEEDENFVGLPPTECLCVREDDCKSGQCGSETDERLEELDVEVYSVCQFVENADTEEGPDEG